MTWHFFIATDCTPITSEQRLDDFEEIEVALISIDELIHNAKNARMSDADAVLLAYEKLIELKGEE